MLVAFAGLTWFLLQTFLILLTPWILESLANLRGAPPAATHACVANYGKGVETVNSTPETERRLHTVNFPTNEGGSCRGNEGNRYTTYTGEIMSPCSLFAGKDGTADLPPQRHLEVEIGASHRSLRLE